MILKDTSGQRGGAAGAWCDIPRRAWKSGASAFRQTGIERDLRRQNLDEIYVTTAGASDRKIHGKDAGALFRLRLGIKGLPEFFSNVRA